MGLCPVLACLEVTGRPAVRPPQTAVRWLFGLCWVALYIGLAGRALADATEQEVSTVSPRAQDSRAAAAETPTSSADVRLAEEPRARLGASVPNGWALGAAIVPGFLLHGSGSWVMGDDEAATLLIWSEVTGLGAVLVPGSGIVLTGASQWVTGPLAATTVLGAGLFGVGLLTDVYHVSVPLESRGTAQRLRKVTTRLSYLFVRDPQFEYTHFLQSDARLWVSRWALGYRALHAPGQGYAGLRVNAARRFWQGQRHPSGHIDGSFLDVGVAVWERQLHAESFRTRSAELLTTLRVDGERFLPQLLGTFSQWNVGYALRSTDLRATGALQEDTQLLAGAAFGAYLPGAGARGGEFQLFYEHRHDGLVGGMLARGLGSGVIGSVGSSADYYLSEHFGVAASARVGSAWVLSAGLVIRGLGDVR